MRIVHPALTIMRAVDPALTCTGWAIFDGYGALIRAGLARTKPTKNLTARLTAMYGQIPIVPDDARRVSERMVHRGRNAKTSPAALLDINLLAGMLANEFVAPHEWKGTVDKDVFCKRILGKLCSAERAIVLAVKPASLRHNAIDAVGIGLHFLGRLRKDWT